MLAEVRSFYLCPDRGKNQKEESEKANVQSPSTWNHQKGESPSSQEGSMVLIVLLLSKINVI
jgi:hypothetical protein